MKNRYINRFITHLKFFAQRLFLENKQYTDEDNPLYHIVKEQYKKAFNCTQSVVKFVDNKFKSAKPRVFMDPWFLIF